MNTVLASSPSKAPRYACCPSCSHSGRFDYLGEQKYPTKVALQKGGIYSISLWTCEQCHTTVSERSLLPSDKPAA